MPCWSKNSAAVLSCPPARYEYPGNNLEGGNPFRHVLLEIIAYPHIKPVGYHEGEDERNQREAGSETLFPSLDHVLLSGINKHREIQVSDVSDVSGETG